MIESKPLILFPELGIWLAPLSALCENQALAEEKKKIIKSGSGVYIQITRTNFEYH
jgi:hypothetical protein